MKILTYWTDSGAISREIMTSYTAKSFDARRRLSGGVAGCGRFSAHDLRLPRQPTSSSGRPAKRRTTAINSSGSNGFVR